MQKKTFKIYPNRFMIGVSPRKARHQALGSGEASPNPSPAKGIFCLTSLLQLIIAAYQLLISPWLGARCRFEPSCSAYAKEALQTHGIFKGGTLLLTRILRCHPFGACGFTHDPVPPAVSISTQE